VGLILAIWAVLVSVLGITRHNFPGSDGAAKAVMAISAILVVCAIGAGIATSESPAKGEGGGEPAPSAPSPAGGQSLKLTADPNNGLSFNTDQLSAKPGQVQLTMTNPASLPHNISLEGKGVDEEGKTVQDGGTSQVEADLKPGTYTYYCSIPGHRESGMEGTLTVK
jgi:plastocyanin